MLGKAGLAAAIGGLRGPRAPLESPRDQCVHGPGQSFPYPLASSQLMRTQGSLSGKGRFPFLLGGSRKGLLIQLLEEVSFRE